MSPPPPLPGSPLYQQSQPPKWGEEEEEPKACNGVDERLGSKWCCVPLAITFLFFINVLNYIDRGIVPGSSKEFLSFISDTMDTEKPNVYLGLLQSAFIVGFTVAALIFGHIIHYYPPFKLVGVGLCIWVVATFLSGLSKTVHRYEFLVFARMLSGVGEASFQCVVPPFISDVGGDAGGRWLAFFFAAIPVGTAIGYGWGALFSSSSLGWGWAFFSESIIMLPFAIGCFFLPFKWRPNRPVIEDYDDDDDECFSGSSEEEGGREGNGELDAQKIALLGDKSDTIPASNGAITVNGNGHALVTTTTNRRHQTAWEEFKAVVASPIFVLTALAYAASTGVMIGLSTFGSGMLLEFGYFKSEAQASLAIGAMVSVAGMIGTPLGGFIIDRAHAKGDEAKLVATTRMNFTFCVLGAAVASISTWTYNEAGFIVTFTLGALFLFVPTSGVNLAEMSSVPPENRSFAIALNTLCIHALGDVPSPIVVGSLLDTMAPACAALMRETTEGDFVVSDGCKAEVSRVRLVMFITCMWLCISCVLTGLAWLMAWRLREKHRREHHLLHHHHHHQHTPTDPLLQDSHER